MSEKILTEEEAGSTLKNAADETATDALDDDAVEREAVDLEEAVADDESVPEEPPSLEEQLEAAHAEAAKNLDGWMRAQAEFSNARKRMEKQRAETYHNATADVVSRLLPVLDDFGRALDEVPADVAENSWLEGMDLVRRKLLGILDSFNVTSIQAVGQPFDPNLHEAIMQEPSEEYESGVVTKELQQGYKLGDRVVRPALVYVAE